MSGHMTKFGNYYTEEEWAALQAGFAQEQAEYDDFMAKMRVIKRQAMKMIEGSGLFTSEQMPKIRGLLEDPSQAQFTSKEKREVVEAASQWFNEKMKGVK